MKLVLEEDESAALTDHLRERELMSCRLALVEVPWVIRRATAPAPQGLRSELLAEAGRVLERVALLPLDPPVLIAAGALADPLLRSLDAIHVAAALSVSSVDVFVTYDERQAAAARLCGLRTVSPGR